MAFRSQILLLVALHSAAAYQLPLVSKPSLGLRAPTQTQTPAASKLRTSSRPLSSTLSAQVVTMPQPNEFLSTKSSKTLNDLQHTLKGSEILIDEVLLGVEVGHGIRCHSLPHSIQETTSQEQRTLQRLVAKMHEAAIFSVERPDTEYQLHLNMGEVAAAREEIVKEFNSGERRMAQLAQLLSNRFTDGEYECISTVEAKTKAGKFTLSQAVSRAELEGGADSLALANNQLDSLKVSVGDEEWEQARMLDHSIEFESMASNDANVYRVKAHAVEYADLWKIMSDSIFDIDHPDVGAVDFGAASIFRIRITAEDEADADAVQKKLSKMSFTDGELQKHGVSVSKATRSLDLVSKWKSGRAMEMIWGGTKVGIEVVTLEEDYRRREVSFKQLVEERRQKKEMACADLEEKSTAYGFSRRMLNWIFSERLDTFNPPSMDNLKVRVV
mmetsp:Transcript_130489/g.194275  ORF Transcript_130489/g.194275 Transcript_130489/m.194275 type:complete len:443 (-) Transcript_130489:149-1477(-)